MISDREASNAYTAINAKFAQLFAKPRPDVAQWVSLAGDVVNSSAITEAYPFLGATRGMRKWEGKMPAGGANLTEGLQVRNEAFYDSLSVPKLMIKANTLGGINLGIGQLAKSAAEWPVPFIQQVIAGTSGLTGYDGNVLFHAAHKDGKTSQTNIVSGTGHTLDQIATDLASVVVKMSTWKNDQGVQMSGYMPDTIVIPATGAVYLAFRKLVQNNTFNLDNWSDVVKRVLVNPLMSGNTWHAVCTQQMLGAVIWQVLEAPTTGYQNEIDEPNMLYAVSAYGAFAVGDWRCAVQVTNS